MKYSYVPNLIKTFDFTLEEHINNALVPEQIEEIYSSPVIDWTVKQLLQETH